MPRGTRHELVGRLREIDGRWSLRPDDGGEWRFDVGLLLSWRARRLTLIRASDGWQPVGRR